MTKYQLAKLVMLAGTIHTRKRVQKLVYLLQAAGFHFQTEFRLHHFGPYSTEVAELLNAMTRQGILDERKQSNVVGWQSEYIISDTGKENLLAFEATPKGQALAAEFEEFAPQIRLLFDVSELWDLELGATIAYFHERTHQWEEAVRQACKFKNTRPEAPKTKNALQLARQLVR